MIDSDRDVLWDLMNECHDDADLFNEIFVNDGRSFWKRQREMCESVVKYRTTAIYSGNMVGKDFWVGRIIWWWLYTRPDSLVIVTGPVQRLWAASPGRKFGGRNQLSPRRSSAGP